MSLSLLPISPLLPEYGQIEYQIQLQLKAPRLKLSECFEFGNPHVNVQFLSYAKTLNPANIVEIYVPTSDIQQLVVDISSKGIKVDPKRGFRFRVGSFEVDKSKDVIEVIHMSVALGNTLNFQLATSSLEEGTFTNDQPTVANLRNGYNSLCVSDKGDYVIFNPSQVKSCHLVRFKGGANLDEIDHDDNLCDLCSSNPASIWCINDSAKLCENCDSESHKANRIMEKHKRIPLSEARALMEYCPVHGDVRVEYYCTQCKSPVCINCKMTGSHSKGDAASHPLIPIKSAYNSAIETSSRDNQAIIRRDEEIDEKISIVDQRLLSIKQNAQQVEDEIMRIATAAIEETRSLAGEKALLVRSIKTELMRKKKEMQEYNTFIQTHKSYSGPLSFLTAFDRHQAIMKQMEEGHDLPQDLKIEGDLCVFGSINVAPTDEPIAKPAKASTPKAKPAQQNLASPIKTRSITIESDNASQSYNESDDYEDEQYQQPKVQKNYSINQSPPSPNRNKSMSSTPAEITSLVEIAKRKELKNKARGLDLTFCPFEDSSILKKKGFKCALYLCFPFKALPQTHLLFSTKTDGRSIEEMHRKIDGVGITAILVKTGEHVFGGFAAAKWNSDGIPFGENSSSFLFSITQDAFIPYRPRIKDACHLYATSDSLTFGKYDLVLADDFDKCSAVIENSYGVGFQQGSTDAKTFLAGKSTFKADIVEVWGFFTIESAE